MITNSMSNQIWDRIKDSKQQQVKNVLQASEGDAKSLGIQYSVCEKKKMHKEKNLYKEK